MCLSHSTRWSVIGNVLSVRCLLICDRQIEISDTQWVFSDVWDYLCVSRCMARPIRRPMMKHDCLPSFVDFRHADRNIGQALGCLSDVRD